jgi:hypothetical protein
MYARPRRYQLWASEESARVRVSKEKEGEASIQMIIGGDVNRVYDDNNNCEVLTGFQTTSQVLDRGFLVDKWSRALVIEPSELL